ncbi:MAG TPA: IS21 family transposase [Paenisporosarcina sp.]|nr:IS21 family transposase [Paenisporosarcina sp.]
MTISNELEAKILRYYHVEKWRVGTIADQLGVHHSVVNRVLSQAGFRQEKPIPTHSIVEPYLPFMQETLKKFPTLTASRLYEMVCERGYPGGPDHFRYIVSLYRPRPRTEAYLRLRTLPGEQAQVDWGHFGNIIIGRAKRPLMAFVMVLSFSRRIFLRFYLNQRMSNFLDGHEAAFHAFNGIARVLLYDNLKSAVLEREGDAIRFHPTLLEFSSHYRFEPRPVAIARGNEKGRVERAIRYVRDNFFAARQWGDLEDLNKQAQQWCEGVASNRPCPEDPSLTVREVFLQEQPVLLDLPNNPYPAQEREEVKVGKTPYVRFDLNDYSVPHSFTRRLLTVRATQTVVSVLDGTHVIAQHSRSYDKGKQIEDESHIKDLVAAKKQARLHRGQDRLIQSLPCCEEFLIAAAARGYVLRSITHQLLLLLDSYGATEMNIAVNEALTRGVPHPNAVRLHLEKRREERQKPPPIHLDLPNDKRVREQVVRSPNLNDYDQLHSLLEENHE